MRITCLFGQRKSQPEAIELMVAWDEYCIDSNPEGFEEDCEKAKKSWGDELLQWRLLDLSTNEENIKKLFDSPTLPAKVVAE